MTRCWRSCSRRMRLSSGEALSASEPSGWMVRSMDSASGRRLVVSADESVESPGSLPTSRAGGDCSSDCQEATSLARRAMACSSVGFERRAGNLRLGGELRGVEEAAAGNGDLLFEQQAQLRR